MNNAATKALDALRQINAVSDVLGRLVDDGEEAFLAETRSQWAAEMGLIRIGESVNRIPEEVLLRYPGQPWRTVVAMRNFAAHQYDDLERGRVWRTLVVNVPQLRDYVSTVMIPGLTDPTGSGNVPDAEAP